MMSDDKPPSTQPQQKGWMEKISHFLIGEPQDRDELLEILREARKRSVLDSEALSMIEGVLQVSVMRVREVMIPRIQMIVVAADALLEDVFPIVIESAHSRFPVIREDRSDVAGILLAKDMLAYMFKKKAVKVEDIMRPASFIPESKRLNVLLNEFRCNRNHMAIVVDEYGLAAGLVTIEDVLEQIVGEIEDEHDIEEEAYIIKRSDTEFTIKALTPIDEFNEYFNANIQDDELDTVGGFVVHQLEHMPKKGEKVKINGFCLEVLRADGRRVHLLKLKFLPKAKAKDKTS